jgi:hypothetical protein
MCILTVTPSFLQAAEFQVNTVAELESTLLLAESNGEDDIINIARGKYQPLNSFSYDSQEDKAITLQGSAGGTIIDGSLSNHRILFIRTYGSNSDININGITLQNGYSPEGEYGAGMLVNIASADLILENLKIINCTGAAFYYTNHGGGAYITAGMTSNVIIRNCVIAGNTAKGQGGGLYLNLVSGTLSFINNTIINNHNNSSVVEGGGGVYLQLFYDTATAHLYNNIFWGNTYNSGDGDLYIEDNGDDAMDDFDIPATINMYNNDYNQLDYNIGTALTLSNNISLDPQLTSDFHLTRTSPCLDTGTSAAPDIPDKDFERHPRSYDGDQDGNEFPDMGADEFYIIVSPVLYMLLLQ